MRRSGFLHRAIFLILPLGVMATHLPAQSTTSPETLFAESCSMCHTIGGGSAVAPDLLPSTSWSRKDLRAAVEKMQENSGPLTAEQIDGLVDLLKDPAVKDRLAGGSKEPESVSPLDSASPADGRRLFYGELKLQNGGAACFACHAVQGSGGTLAADLTDVFKRRGEVPLISATAKPAFPLMRAEYSRKPLTESEALNIAAFLRDTSAGTAMPATSDTATVFGAASGAAVALFVVLGLAIGARRIPRTSGGRS